MSRDAALVSPHARKERKERDVAAERHKRDISQFQDRHPLARLYRDIIYCTYAREEKNWRQFAIYANDIASCYASLDSQLQETLNDALPHQPDSLGELSSWCWIAYLASLFAITARREFARTEVCDLIVGGWGADFLPVVLRPVSSWNYEEPPF